jgi:hypothetical protein
VNIVLKEPYQPRTIGFIELLSLDGWRLKVYGISYKRRFQLLLHRMNFLE